MLSHKYLKATVRTAASEEAHNVTMICKGGKRRNPSRYNSLADKNHVMSSHLSTIENST